MLRGFEQNKHSIENETMMGMRRRATGQGGTCERITGVYRLTIYAMNDRRFIRLNFYDREYRLAKMMWCLNCLCVNLEEDMMVQPYRH